MCIYTYIYICNNGKTWLAGKCPVNGGFKRKSSINGPFSIAMLDYRRVYVMGKSILSFWTKGMSWGNQPIKDEDILFGYPLAIKCSSGKYHINRSSNWTVIELNQRGIFRGLWLPHLWFSTYFSHHDSTIKRTRAWYFTPGCFMQEAQNNQHTQKHVETRWGSGHLMDIPYGFVPCHELVWNGVG